MQSYWQPRGLSLEEAIEGLEAVLPWLTHVHVFSWRQSPGETTRLPLAAGEALWLRLLDIIARDGRDRYAMIEFVRDDEPARFLEDAVTLKAWLSRQSSAP
jgi:hypothetical protein